MLGCYVFYVGVQSLFLTVDVFCVGGSRTFFDLKFHRFLIQYFSHFLSLCLVLSFSSRIVSVCWGVLPFSGL